MKDTPILDVLALIDKELTLSDLRLACRRVVYQSDFAEGGPNDLDDNDRDEIGDAIFDFIMNPEDPPEVLYREITVKSGSILGYKSMEYYEFAHTFSSEFLSCYRNPESYVKESLLKDDDEKLRLYVLEFFASILYRYTWCAGNDLAVFPLSVLYQFADTYARLLESNHLHESRCKMLCASVLALSSRESETPV
jgi:hypothetical protein